jgi:hypothetical protein
MKLKSRRLKNRAVRQADATDRLKAAYRRFLKQRVPEKKQQAGENLIRAIFGPDAMAKDPIH